ncbi:cell division protein FtsB [Clostridium pascui]|uniref:hypothetical protein n=1 Tax=Clostridium pascui TaxID=46609 RepID=UPI00195BC75B|nr:hypothetical protein [Clostridium pascui]MBM7869237.1 cell division protein FtsB [Clostridium pascui]
MENKYSEGLKYVTNNEKLQQTMKILVKLITNYDDYDKKVDNVNTAFGFGYQEAFEKIEQENEEYNEKISKVNSDHLREKIKKIYKLSELLESEDTELKKLIVKEIIELTNYLSIMIN